MTTMTLDAAINDAQGRKAPGSYHLEALALVSLTEGSPAISRKLRLSLTSDHFMHDRIIPLFSAYKKDGLGLRMLQLLPSLDSESQDYAKELLLNVLPVTTESEVTTLISWLERLRQKRVITTQAAAILGNLQVPIGEFTDERLLEIRESFMKVGQMQSVLNTDSGYISDLFETIKPVGTVLRLPWESLNVATRGGMPVGRIITLNGGSGSGKTGLGAQLLAFFERQGAFCGHIAADECREDVLTRYGQHLGFARDLLEADGDAGNEERKRCSAATKGRNLCIWNPRVGTEDLTLEYYGDLIQDMAGERPAVLLVDSVQTVPCAAALNAKDDNQRQDAVVKVASRLADQGVLVILISEMPKAQADTGTYSPTASKGSVSIAHASSLVLNCSAAKDDSGVEIKVAKNRRGPKYFSLNLQRNSDRCLYSEEKLGNALSDIELEANKHRDTLRQMVACVRNGITTLDGMAKVMKKSRNAMVEYYEAAKEEKLLTRDSERGPIKLGPAVSDFDAYCEGKGIE